MFSHPQLPSEKTKECGRKEDTRRENGQGTLNNRKSLKGLIRGERGRGMHSQNPYNELSISLHSEKCEITVSQCTRLGVHQFCGACDFVHTLEKLSVGGKPFQRYHFCLVYTTKWSI